MTRQAAFDKAARISRKRRTTRYVVDDGPDFGADSCGQGGFQVARDEDLEGFYQGCMILATFEDGQICD